jgi:hypothetical protein
MNFNWIQSPCKDCEDRHVNCHSQCERYKGYRAEYEAEATRRFKERSLDAKIGQINHSGASKREKLPEPLRHGRKRK